MGGLFMLVGFLAIIGFAGWIVEVEPIKHILDKWCDKIH